MPPQTPTSMRFVDPWACSGLAIDGSGGHPDLTALQSESVVFYRGACRDGGDWSKSGSATP